MRFYENCNREYNASRPKTNLILPIIIDIMLNRICINAPLVPRPVYISSFYHLLFFFVWPFHFIFVALTDICFLNRIYMYYNELALGTLCDLKVIGKNTGNNYFVVSTDDGHSFSVPKLKFQKNSEIPQYISCVVVKIKNGTPIIRQNLSRIISSMYAKGKSYDFTIKAASPGNVSSYSLIDDNGFVFKLNNAPKNLIAGKKIKCRVEAVAGTNVKLSYQGQLSKPIDIAFHTPDQWLELSGCRHTTPYYKAFTEFPDFTSSRLEFNARNPLWIFTALREFTEAVPSWLDSLDYDANRKDLSTLKRLVRAMTRVRQVCQYILDGSPVLKDLNIEQRNYFQEKLTSYMESLKQYAEASRLILANKDSEFIDGIFQCLKISGFIYHPKKQFRMLMTIFRLRRNLVSEKMGELFEILNEWRMENWTTEPFRTALVEQLEIFISENSPLLDTYGDIETGDDNKLLVKMVLAIAVQSLLAKETDNVDLQLNKARFYRYLSYFNPKDIDILLNQGIRCILGEEERHEFTWADTNNNPGILIEKATNVARQHLASKDSDKPYRKIYSCEEAEIEILEDTITIREKGEQNEISVLPNNVMDWMNPQIILNEGVPTPSAARAKLIRSYDTMWQEIENAIFRKEEEYFKKEEIVVKKRPVAGTPVKARIDAAEKSPSGVLRFHCVIIDDNLEGDGWLDATEATLLPWLSAKDVPAYFNINADFNHSDEGADLLFDMTVIESGSELKFSMKDEIYQYLADLPEFGDISNAFVTHNDPQQTHLLCVSELGYTLKIKSDESNRHLQPGQVIKVKYINRDVPAAKLYMIGEIVDENPIYPSSIKKTTPFINIMRDLGEPVPEDDNTVVEASELLTRDEVQELILMIWRRAFVEQEAIKAYNYLSFAALLAKLIGDNKKMEDILCHKKLMLVKDEFSRNNAILPESLKDFEESTSGNTMLRKIQTRLQTVACLNNTEQNEELWNRLQLTLNDIDRQLISNVMAYNLMASTTDGVGALRIEIMSRISSLLNVNATQQQLKYYGNESHKVEFKTSLVFTAGRNTSVRMHEHNPAEQEHEILKVICGFINAEGGVLYLGVHDSGYEKGLDDDLAYYKNYGYPSNRNLRPNIDNMAVYLTNLIKNKISGFETNGGKVDKDPDAKRDVLKISVNPSPTPVTLENEMFVRSGSSTFHLYGEKREEFCRNREMVYSAMLKRNKEIEEAQNEVIAEEEEEMEEPREIMTENNVDIIEEVIEPESGAIKTGRHRNNVLHDGEDGYILPLIYLSVTKDNAWKVTTTDYWEEFDSRITLNIHDYEQELKDVVRMDIASRHDLLVNIIQIKSDVYCYKALPVTDFPVVSQFTSEGAPVYNQLHKIVAQEIVVPSKKSFCPDSRIFKLNQPGMILNPIDGSETTDEMIERVLRPFGYDVQ